MGELGVLKKLADAAGSCYSGEVSSLIPHPSFPQMQRRIIVGTRCVELRCMDLQSVLGLG